MSDDAQSDTDIPITCSVPLIILLLHVSVSEMPLIFTT